MSSFYIRIPGEGLEFWLTMSSRGLEGLTDRLDEAHDFDTKEEALAILRAPDFLEWADADRAEIVELRVVAVAPADALTQLAECAE